MWSPCPARSEWRNRPPSEAPQPRRFGMKRKTVLKTIGVIAAGAALVGGGTFAAWSDFAEIDGAAGAGVLQLTVSNTSSGSTSMGFGNMAPGEFKIQELYVASNDAESGPNGTLTPDVLNLLATEGHGDRKSVV